MTELVATALFPFGGLGAGARGFLDAHVSMLGREARFRCLGGPLSDDDIEHLGTLAWLVERTASATRDPYDAHPEHADLVSALDLACERLRLDNVAGLRGLAAAGVAPTSAQVEALRTAPRAKRARRGRR